MQEVRVCVRCVLIFVLCFLYEMRKYNQGMPRGQQQAVEAVCRLCSSFQSGRHRAGAALMHAA
jgi:hypothetical protein